MLLLIDADDKYVAHPSKGVFKPHQVSSMIIVYGGAIHEIKIKIRNSLGQFLLSREDIEAARPTIKYEEPFLHKVNKQTNNRKKTCSCKQRNISCLK